MEIRSMRRRIFYEIIKKCQRNVVDMSTNPRVTSVECSTVVDVFRFLTNVTNSRVTSVECSTVLKQI